jgi:hypothetical protein
MATAWRDIGSSESAITRGPSLEARLRGSQRRIIFFAFTL